MPNPAEPFAELCCISTAIAPVAATVILAGYARLFGRRRAPGEPMKVRPWVRPPYKIPPPPPIGRRRGAYR